MTVSTHLTPESKAFFEAIPEVLREFSCALDIMHGECVITLHYLSDLVKVIALLHNHDSCLFNQLTDMTAVDYPEKEKRFHMVYQFLSMHHNKRVRLKVKIRDKEPVPSITSLFEAANWYEREVYDLYGIFFEGHPDLRRILTDYNFSGYPLRKDFPLSGYYEVRFDESLDQVIYEPVVFPQAFRRFDYMSPWEGMMRVGTHALEEDEKFHMDLPGDEKATRKQKEGDA